MKNSNFPSLEYYPSELGSFQHTVLLDAYIEGNHDRSSLTSDTTTWVRYLNDQGYLHLLSIPFTVDGPQITEWDPETRHGSFIHYKGIRIIGAGYLGAGTVRRMKLITEAFLAIDAEKTHQFTILLLHAGPEYIVYEGGGFDRV